MENNLRSEVSAFWNDFFPDTQIKNKYIIDFLERFPILKLAEQSRIFFSIFKFSNLDIEYYSNNTFDVLGIPLEEYIKNPIDVFCAYVAQEHVNSFLNSVKHAGVYFNFLKEKNDYSTNLTVRCGLKYQHSQKGIIKLLWKSQIFEMPNDVNNPQRIMLMMQDITHLMKDDFFWFRAALNTEKDSFYITSRSDTEGYSKKDILSEREKEILRCFAAGKGTEEVAKELFISNVTVKNHRQNMLNKLGARDVTALIQLAKLTKII